MGELFESANLWTPVTAMLCLIFASGFFSASETALFFLSRDELRKFRIGSPSERTVARLLLDPDRVLTAILFWNLVVNLAYFAVSIVIAKRLAESSHPFAAAAFGVFTLFGIILFGEVLPKSLAVVFRGWLSSLVSFPLASSVRLLDPLMPTFRSLTRALRLTFWPKISREPFLDTEDLERAVEASAESDELIRQERLVLDNILDLSEITVEEAMRPRGTYVCLPAPVSQNDLKGEVPPSDYLAILADETDNIEGAVALSTFSNIPTENLELAAEEVVHVPWCASLAFTLQLLRDRFCSMASVVNEFGETIGVITYEDIIDTILVPEPSRARRLLRREPVLEIDPEKYHVEGITTLRYLCRRLGIDFDPESEELVTVAGMVQDELEHIPEVGDTCNWRGYQIKVINVSQRGSLRVMISQEKGEGF